MIEIFKQEDIEKYGFIFEPDKTKCKLNKPGVHYDCNYYKDGKWAEGRIEDDKREHPDEWKSAVADRIKERLPHYKYIHSVWIPDVNPLSGQGVMCRWLFVDGHD